MPRRLVAFALLAVSLAAVCVSLGLWQLRRLGERRARNAVVVARTALPPAASLRELPADTAAARFRRVRLAGRYDYAHEVALTGRTHEGSPGVNIVTPLRLADTAVAVLVNRGWVYSPNSADVDLARWREGDSARVVEGFVNTVAAGRGAPRSSAPHAVRWIDPATLARDAGYPVTPYTVVLQGDSAVPGTPRFDSTPARLPLPPLDEGPHLSYAFQWFSFAAIALGGLGIVLLNRRKGT